MKISENRNFSLPFVKNDVKTQDNLRAHLTASSGTGSMLLSHVALSKSRFLSGYCCIKVRNYALKAPKAVKHEGGIFLKKFRGLICSKIDEEFEKNGCGTIG